MKKFIALVLALVMVLALCACGAKEEAPAAAPAESATLILGTSADYAPFEFMYPDESGEMVYGGIDVSVAKYIAEYTGKELKIENMGFDYLLASLQKGDFDMVIAAMEETEERLNAADFSDPYYTDYPPMVLVKADKAAEYTTLESFAGKSVGAQTATTKEDIVKNDMPGANLVSIQLVTDLVNQLVNDKLDAIVLDGAVALQYAESNPDLVVCEAVSLGEAYPYRVAVKEGDPKGLLESINKTLAQITTDGTMDQYIAEAEANSASALEG